MKKIVSFLLLTLFISSFSACDKENNWEERETGFEVPELTASNTIQFTVNAGDKASVEIFLHGGKIAVDWGDGEVTKDIYPENAPTLRSQFIHTYKIPGDYRVKIWADEVTFINLSSLLRSYEQLHVGNCPVLESAIFNSFSKDKTLNLNGCKKLESLNLGNWQALESVALDECEYLKEALIYTNPKLTALDCSKNSCLTTFHCQDTGIEELQLPKSVVDVHCFRNNLQSVNLKNYKQLRFFNCNNNEALATLNLSGCDELQALAFANTEVKLFDFSEFPELVSIDCSNTRLSTVNISENRNLQALSCTNLGLTSLGITHLPHLMNLDCSNNELTTLDVSQNTYFRNLYINGNQLEKEELEAIFQNLPVFDGVIGRATAPAPRPAAIKIFNNPGTAECNTKLITDKGWVIKTE